MLTGWEPSLSEGWENFSGCKANVLLRRSALKRPDGAMVFWKVKYDWGRLLYASFLFLLCVPVAPFPFFPTSNLSVSLFSSSSVCVTFWGGGNDDYDTRNPLPSTGHDELYRPS